MVILTCTVQKIVGVVGGELIKPQFRDYGDGKEDENWDKALDRRIE